ncbi:MAG: translation initiation factor IF-3 [Parcubacteria group bacterium]|nr:translation initiation factor IF-3 [Parcubacteria group bacterium]
MKAKVRINNQIRAQELRVVTDDGENLGVIPFKEALEAAQGRSLDLIEISPNATPPVAKIMDYGKFQYLEQKKQKGVKVQGTETKSLQIKIGTGEHDLELKAKQASKFLKEGCRVKMDLFLAGRAKYLPKEFLQERLERVLRLITEEYKIADGPRRSPKGLAVILERAKK